MHCLNYLDVYFDDAKVIKICKLWFGIIYMNTGIQSVSIISYIGHVSQPLLTSHEGGDGLIRIPVYSLIDSIQIYI